MNGVGAAKIPRQPIPIGDLLPGVGIRVRVAAPVGARLAVEILELHGDFANDPRFALGDQIGQRQASPNEGVPITHARSPWRRGPSRR